MRRSTASRRAPTTAAVVPALALLAAVVTGCAGGGTGSGGGPERDGGGRVPPLTAAQLRQALLTTGAVPGYQAERHPEDPLPDRDTLEPDRPACEPLTDTVDSRPARPRGAYTGGVLRKDATGPTSTVQQVLLSAYPPGEAERWLADMRTALRACQRFTATLGTGERAKLEIDAGKGVGVGDESVRFTMRDATGRDFPTVFTVVRTGDNTATYLSVGVLAAPEPPPRVVMAEQHARLVAASAG